MTKRMTFDERMDARQAQRMKAEDKFLAIEERRSAAAEALVGELCREGETIHYINVRTRDGGLTGKTKEFPGVTGYGAAINYLMRNRYV